MGLAKFFQGLRKKEPQPDDLYGTGVWRQHRDRFNRAVDRFFVTASRLHEEAQAGTTQDAHVQAAEQIAALTHTLNQVAQRVDDCARTLHTHVPVNEQTIPAQVRTQVGTLPELMSRAATKVAEAAQAAAMVRAQVRTTSGGVTENSETDEASQAGPAEVAGVSAARRYVDDAARLVDECHRIAERIASSDKSK
ncbi:hypothetical protein QP868_08700 [Brevibacterium sp. UMB1308A]|uniref:hypothetical protein n=1 Tax=Brevibacterium sp. UMB1308A TaxID=3050608 RepID=UPI002549DF49|nr:hypothetical protein [Brevibacterium sp. UMB1308A]MDK8346822.1 hypothetical protein [Brevibacterium sp. UMB1308B]MDK8713970.1 hypothetical protein [Brevibacterium sp. UMB1308A]